MRAVAASLVLACVVGRARADERAAARKVVVSGAVTAVAGLVLASTGGGLEGRALRERDALERLPEGTAFDPHAEDRMRAFHASALTLLSVGAAAVVSGAVVIAIGATRLRRVER